VHSSLCFWHLNLLPHAIGVLEAQAINLTFLDATALSILNIYNPNGSVTHQEFTLYVQQLPSPHLLVGNFDAHSPILSTRTNKSDATGRALEDLLLMEPLILINPIDLYTYIDCCTGRPGTGHF
jgi:hypothetical protein